MNRLSPEHFYSSESSSYDSIMVDSIIVGLSRPIQCTTPTVNP